MTSSHDRRTTEGQERGQRRKQAQKSSTETTGPVPNAETETAPLAAGLGEDFSQATFQRHAALLGDPRLSHPANARQRDQVVRQLQRDYGNQYVQRVVERFIQSGTGEAAGLVAMSPVMRAARGSLDSAHPGARAATPAIQREWQGPDGEILSDIEYEERFGPTSQEGWTQISSDLRPPALTEEEEDEVVSDSILDLFEEFENIPIEWTEEQPEDFVGPPRGFLVHVRAVYFINSAGGKANFADERRRERFNSIVRALRDKASIMESSGGSARSAGRTVQVGKATPEDIKAFVEEAIGQGIITRFALRRGVLERGQELVDLPRNQIQTVIQDWMEESAVGVDCSGLVVQAAHRSRQALRASSQEAGAPEEALPPEVSTRIRGAASFRRGPRVSTPQDLRPGHMWVVPGHIRVVSEVEDREDHVRFGTVESRGGRRGGPGPTNRTWRTSNLEEFHPITLVDGGPGGEVGGTFHEVP